MKCTYRCGIVYEDDEQRLALRSLDRRLANGWITTLIPWSEINIAVSGVMKRQPAIRQYHALAFLSHKPLTMRQLNRWRPVLSPFYHAWGVIVSDTPTADEKANDELRHIGFTPQRFVASLADITQVATTLDAWLAEIKVCHDRSWAVCPWCETATLLEQIDQQRIICNPRAVVYVTCKTCEQVFRAYRTDEGSIETQYGNPQELRVIALHNIRDGRAPSPTQIGSPTQRDIR